MNAYELADFVEISKPDDKSHQMIATMLRHQADYIKHLEEGLESALALNKAQAGKINALKKELYFKDYYEELPDTPVDFLTINNEPRQG
jgi:hypothetical protein